MFAEIARVHDEWVDVVVRVDLTGTNERITVPGLAVASSRVSTTSSVGVGRREGVLSLNSLRNVVVKVASGSLGRRSARWVGVFPDKDTCGVFPYAIFLHGLAPGAYREWLHWQLTQ